MSERDKAIIELQRRVDSLQKVANRVSPLEDRLSNLEKLAISYKDILTLQETAMYLGVSLSQLYKLTSTNNIPHYKPRGKMCYFERKELDKWLLRNHCGPNINTNNE